MQKYKNKVANSVFMLNFVFEIIIGIVYSFLALDALSNNNLEVFLSSIFVGAITVLLIHIFSRVIPEIIEKLHLIEEHLNTKSK